MLRQLVATHQNKGVPVEILKPGKGAAPGWCLRWMMKVNPALAPLVELGADVLSRKNDIPALPDEFVFVHVRSRSTKGKYSAAMGRGDRHPTVSSFIANVNEQIEPQLV